MHANFNEPKQHCKEEKEILHNDVRDSQTEKENDSFKLLLLKVALQAAESQGALFTGVCVTLKVWDVPV